MRRSEVRKMDSRAKYRKTQEPKTEVVVPKVTAKVKPKATPVAKKTTKKKTK